MARARENIRALLGHQWAIIGVLLIAVFAVRSTVNSPTLGLSLFYILPTLLASVWLGVRQSVLVGLAAGGLYYLDALINAEPYPLLGATLRAAVYCSVGAGFAVLFRRQLELRTQVADRDRQLSDLRVIREALVPAEMPERPSVELAGSFVPAQQTVGGDFYLAAPGPKDTTVVVVGDAIGKGIDAARRASFARAALASFASFTDDPGRLLEMANYSLIERSGVSDSFVTAACVSIRPAERSIAWALAGHPAPVLLDEGAALDVERPGVPLGVELDVGASVSERDLPAECGLLLFTDGLLEARADGAGADSAPAGEQFGPERVADSVRAMSGAPPGEVVQELRTAAERFAGGTLTDDLCLVAARMRANGG